MFGAFSKKTILAGIFIVLNSFTVQAQEQFPRKCLSAPITFDLLGGAMDTPIIPVDIDNKPAALYVSFAFDNLYFDDVDGFNFKHEIDDDFYGSIKVWNKLGEEEKGDPIILQSITFSGSEIDKVRAILIEKKSDDKIAGRPVVGVLGYNLLKNVSVLFDIPHNKIMFFLINGDKKCSPVYEHLLGAHYYEDDLQYGMKFPRVLVEISGKKYLFYMDTDLKNTEIPEEMITGRHLVIKKLENNTEVTTDMTSHYISQIGEIDSVRIGNFEMNNFPVQISQKILNGTLGLSFFQDKLVLMDFPHEKMYFSEPVKNIQNKGHNMHYHKVKRTNILVQ